MPEFHYPECPASRPDTPHVVSIAAEACQFWGICDRLRACEERVRDEMRQPDPGINESAAYARAEGFGLGVQAAREAVAAKRSDFAYATDTQDGHILLRIYDDALAAIDGLRGES